jgi:hypothetical protein
MHFLSVRNHPTVDELAERSSISLPVHMLTECDFLSRYNTATAAWHALPIATYISRLQRSCHPPCLSLSPYRRRFSSPSFSTKMNYKTTVTQRRGIPPVALRGTPYWSRPSRMANDTSTQQLVLVVTRAASVPTDHALELLWAEGTVRGFDSSVPSRFSRPPVDPSRFIRRLAQRSSRYPS